MNFFFLICFIVSWHFSSFAGSSFEQRELVVNGFKRFYLFHRSSNFKKDSPVLFLLHGGTQSMRKVIEDTSGKRWTDLSNQHGFLLAVPNASNQTGESLGNNQTWNDC